MDNGRVKWPARAAKPFPELIAAYETPPTDGEELEDAGLQPYRPGLLKDPRYIQSLIATQISAA